ncbi:MAG: DinB family protein [Phycisphaerales bacterium]|nr:DinB family protein [Phycisphaerales bacterium]
MAHPPALAAAILITWKRNGAYALRLVGDLAAEQWTAQPVPGRTLNHPAWVFSHLNIYTPIAAALARGRPFADPVDHPFGQKSEVSPDPRVYEPGPELAAAHRRLHDDAEAALATTTDAILSAPNPVERWRTMHPTVGDMLVTLMVKHESGHLGQISAWRRALGLPRVAM